MTFSRVALQRKAEYYRAKDYVRASANRIRRRTHILKRFMDASNALKAEGNDLFKSRKYAEAGRCYALAIAKCPRKNFTDLSQLYVRLATTELMLDKVMDAIHSATKAIKFDGTNATAYLRRASAYLQTGALLEAYSDFETASKMQPNDAYLKSRLADVRRALTASGTSIPTVSPQSARPPPPTPVASTRFTAAWADELMRDLLVDRRPSADDFMAMIKAVTDIHRRLPNISTVSMMGTIHIVGDVHGQYQDLFAIFTRCGRPSAGNPYLVNGDFVDRGSMGVEVLIALMAWKLVDTRSVHLNRGNQYSSTFR
jgi:serine/threonine-protein phosphatase 5